MNQIAFVFSHSPHGHASGREGLDALLATSAYSEQIAAFFIDDGVYQLVEGQQPSVILAKDYAPMFKLCDLYDIEHIYVLDTSLEERGLSLANLLIPVTLLPAERFHATLERYSVKLMF